MSNRAQHKDSWIVRILAIVFLIGGFQIAIQYFAHQFNYQPQLGRISITCICPGRS